MPLSSSEINALKMSIAQGEVEMALDALVKQLEPVSNEWNELLQAIRVNQADYLQVKAQVIRGTIAPENARLAYNQINVNILEILERIESGKKTLAPATPPPANSQPWRYYVAGGVVTLALALGAWAFFSGSENADCPSYGKGISERIMLLPFKKAGAPKEITPEIDISDGLNDLIGKDDLLKFRAESDVFESYDIEKNYPNPSEATEIAMGCGVEMIVWGKMRNNKDTVEVRYKLLNPAVKTGANGNNDLNALLEMVDEGVWVDNIKTISKMLYLVIANQKGDKAMAMSVFRELQQPLASLTNGPLQADTSAMPLSEVSRLLSIADFLRSKPETVDEALAIYDQILAVYPDNEQALQRRGALNYSNDKFWAAARDLQQVEPDPAKTDPKILKVRVDAYLKCGWPDKARQDLEQYKKVSPETQDKAFIKDREKAIADSLKAYNIRLEATQQLADKKPEDVNIQLSLAQVHTALGEPDKAIAIAENVKRKKPKNEEVYKTVAEAAAQKGDLEKVEATAREANRVGVSTKGFRFLSPTVRALATEKLQ